MKLIAVIRALFTILKLSSPILLQSFFLSLFKISGYFGGWGIGNMHSERNTN